MTQTAPPKPEEPIAPLSWWANNAITRRARSASQRRIFALVGGVMTAILSTLACIVFYAWSGTMPTQPNDMMLAFGLPFVIPLVMSPAIFSWFLRVVSELNVRSERMEAEITCRQEVEARLENLVSTDELTGLPNRRAFFARTAARPEREPLAVALVDLDHFKAINDSGGHAAGDAALRAVGGVLADDDGLFAARLGGEEFGLVIVGTSLAEAQRALDDLRMRIRAAGHGLSASIGVAQWTPTATIDEALAMADAALYRAKMAGRDRVESHVGGPPVSDRYPVARSQPLQGGNRL